MPSFWSAVAVLLARFSISQMDVPARQSYVMAVVAPHLPFFIAGTLKIVYDLSLYKQFVAARPPEEIPQRT